MYYNQRMNNELYHYGILGMKWGVRRYQNYNGSYTKAGLKRFEKSKDSYETGKNIYKSVKNNKEQKRSIRRQNKQLKKQMKKDYKHLKQDKLADQGKQLYSKGYRITNNVGTKLTSIGTGGLTATGFLYANKMINENQTKTLATISGSVATVGAGISFVNYNKERKLRAFYGHTSNY